MKKNKEEFVDDGRSFANMDVEGMPRKFTFDKNRKREYDVSKEEKKHLIIAGYKAFLPVVIYKVYGSKSGDITLPGGFKFKFSK